MMEIELGQILGKARDFKICNNCNSINWHENENCWQCGEKENFRKDVKEIEEKTEDNINYYEKKGYANPPKILTEV